MSGLRPGADGSFALGVAFTGSFRVSAEHAGYQTSFAHRGKPLALAPGRAHTPVEIALSAGERSLTGTVVDATGGPIAHARVQIARVERGVEACFETRTDEDGHFTAALVPGRAIVRATADGYAPNKLATTMPAKGLTIPLTPASALRGVVLDAITRAPVSGADVHALAEGRLPDVAPALSSDDGSFLIGGLEPGSYLLEASAPHHRGASRERVGLGLAETRAGIEVLVMPARQVTGSIQIESSGAPCRRGSVSLGPASVISIPAPPDAERKARDIEAAAFHAPIDENGIVRLHGVAPGRYHVTLVCDGFTYSKGPAIVQVEDRDLRLAWQVREGLGLAISVRDAAGRPAPILGLSIEWPLGADGALTRMGLPVDANGKAELRGNLRPGRYKILVDSSFGVPDKEVELHEGDGLLPVEVKLAGSSTLVVDVRDGQNAPVENVMVRAISRRPLPTSVEQKGGAASIFAVARGNGQFALGPMVEGDYTVEVSDRVNPALAEPAVHLVAAREARLSVRLVRDGALSGQVLDDLGAPVPNAWVTVSQDQVPREAELPSVSFGEIQPRRVLSDPEGTFRIEGLSPQATFRVHAETEDGAASEMRGVRVGSALKLRLDRPGILSGVVLLPNGTPAHAYSLTVLHINTQNTRGLRVSSTDGQFQLSHVPAGDLEIFVDSQQGSARQTLSVAPACTLSGLRLVLTPRPEATPSAEAREVNRGV